MRNFFNKFGIAATLLLLLFAAGCSSTSQVQNNGVANYSWLNLDTVKAGKYDTGTMWTFDYPPLKYFKEKYNFTPSEQWLNNVRMSALRFANYCSASFVSADGLVMTNHHCGRESVAEVTKPGEDLFDNGFYAKTLADERPVPGLYVDQLVAIKDVTNEIQTAMNQGTTPEEKVMFQNSEMNKLKKQYEKETGLRVQIVTLYNGGKYSLYEYKRYTDVRLVFSPEASLGYFGGDYDNFTYPRYDLDCNFFRVYENGKPLHTEHYFHWSPDGAEPGEPVFVVGNPGHTDRLKTVAQLEFLRDVQYPMTLKLLDNLVDIYSSAIKNHPELKAKLQNRLFGFSNSQKAYTGMLAGLRDPVLMQKKVDFEKKFQAAVDGKPDLKSEYGDLWSKIAALQKEKSRITNTSYALSLSTYVSSKYFIIARDVINIADQLKLPVDQRSDEYKGAQLDSTIDNLVPNKADYDLDNAMLKTQIANLYKFLGSDKAIVEKITGGNTGNAAVNYMLSNTVLTNAAKLKALIKEGPDAIMKSSDPFIYFLVHTEAQKSNLQNEEMKIASEEATYSQELGKALFDVYGTSIPPDATFTLRISDGVVKGYPYNGTIAPPFTTFYGLYDRYYSFGKKYPWNLPE